MIAPSKRKRPARELGQFSPDGLAAIRLAANEAGKTPEEFVRWAVCGYVCSYLADATDHQDCPALSAAFGFGEEAA